MQDLCTVINQVNKRVQRLENNNNIPPKVDSEMWQKNQLAIKMTNKKQDRKQKKRKSQVDKTTLDRNMEWERQNGRADARKY